MDRSTDNKTPIEKLASLTPLISVFIIILGGIRLSVFYSFFNVDIFSFVDLSQILMSFLDTALILPISMATIYILYEIFLDYELDSSLLLKKKRFLEMSIYKKITYFLTKRWVYIIMYIIFYFFVPWLLYKSLKFNLTIFLLILFFIFLSMLVKFFDFIYEYKKEVATKVSRRFSISLFLSSCADTFLFSLFVTIIKAFLIKTSEPTIEIELLKNDGLRFKTDKENLFIGKTKEYLFIFHKQENSTEVFKMSEVRTINFKDYITK